MNRKMNGIAWSAALLVLAAALVYFNIPAASGPAAAEAPAAPDPLSQYPSDAPWGHEVGEQLPDFTITQTDGAEFTLSEYRGRVTLINLWATWCTPWVNELPHFDRLQQAHPDDVKVLAIHSDLITDDPLAYLAGFDYQMSFAVDEGGQVIASVGGSTMLPQTVVLNAHGEVIYNRVGSVTYEALEELVEKAQSAGESAAP